MTARRAVNDVRWGAVMSGTVVGLGFMALFASLWVAWGYAGNMGIFSDNMQWWMAGTGVAAFFVAGLVSGFVSGVRGVVAGFLNAATVWGLITTIGIALAVGVGFGTLLDVNGSGFSSIDNQVSDMALWATFGAIVVGLASAALGGVLGGVAVRPVTYAPVETRDEHVARDEAYPEDRTIALDREREYADEPGRHRR